MNDNVRKVFEMLGVEPNEKFKVMSKGNVESEVLHIDTGLRVLTNTNIVAEALRCLITGEWQIVKLPKDVKKKKLRDITSEEFEKWMDKNCRSCKQCPFRNIHCTSDPDDTDCWVNHKELYSDKFLDQEVEVPEE